MTEQELVSQCQALATRLISTSTNALETAMLRNIAQVPANKGRRNDADPLPQIGDQDLPSRIGWHEATLAVSGDTRHMLRVADVMANDNYTCSRQYAVFKLVCAWRDNYHLDLLVAQKWLNEHEQNGLRKDHTEAQEAESHR